MTTNRDELLARMADEWATLARRIIDTKELGGFTADYIRSLLGEMLAKHDSLPQRPEGAAVEIGIDGAERPATKCHHGDAFDAADCTMCSPPASAVAEPDETEKHIRAFFDRHGLPNLTNPSCLACGHAKLSRGIQHMTLPNIYICGDCVAKIRSPEQAATVSDAIVEAALDAFKKSAQRSDWRKIGASSLHMRAAINAALALASSPAAPAPVIPESEKGRGIE